MQSEHAIIVSNLDLNFYFYWNNFILYNVICKYLAGLGIEFFPMKLIFPLTSLSYLFSNFCHIIGYVSWNFREKMFHLIHFKTAGKKIGRSTSRITWSWSTPWPNPWPCYSRNTPSFSFVCIKKLNASETKNSDSPWKIGL